MAKLYLQNGDQDSIFLSTSKVDCARGTNPLDTRQAKLDEDVGSDKSTCSAAHEWKSARDFVQLLREVTKCNDETELNEIVQE